MKVSELAKRYAKAVYELAIDNKTEEKVFQDLRAIEASFSKDKEIHEFLVNPMIDAKMRADALEKAMAGKGVSKEATDLVLLLARRDRFSIFHELVAAYEQQADDANKVCRGTVRSASVLGQDERTKIEATVERVLKKKVIMTYKVDPSVIGGLIAQVGSYTFDDTIASHLSRMNDELNRRTV
jgi:F-type H+-transporting ATPase subunit delta